MELMITTESNRAGAGNYKRGTRVGSKVTKHEQGKLNTKPNNKDRKEDDLHTMKHVYQGEAMSIAHWSVRVEM